MNKSQERMVQSIWYALSANGTMTEYGFQRAVERLLADGIATMEDPPPSEPPTLAADIARRGMSQA